MRNNYAAMRRFGLINFRHRCEKKSPRSGVQGRKRKKETTFNTPKYFILAVILFLALSYKGLVWYLRTQNEIASNDDTLKQSHTTAIRNTTMLDDNFPVVDANTHVKDVDAQMKDAGIITPDANIVMRSEDDSISLDNDPNISEVHLTQEIFGRAPIREGVDLSQCLESPLDVFINDTIVAGWGCDMFETAFNYPEINMTKVGKGYFRDVFAGEIYDQKVALKVLRSERSKSSTRNLLRHMREASILKAVHEQFSEPESHIVTILGFCGEHSLGDLIFADTEPFSFDFVIKTAIQAALGVRTIHAVDHGPVVHTDIKPDQFLFSEDGKLLLNDLNRCRVMKRSYETDHLTPNLRGEETQEEAEGKACPFEIPKANGVWRAPEEYLIEWLDEKIDIYSLGVVYWVMMTRRLPDSEHESSEEWKKDVINGVRPMLYERWNPSFRELLKRMWAPNPADRPDAAMVVQRLEDIHKNISGEI